MCCLESGQILLQSEGRCVGERERDKAEREIYLFSLHRMVKSTRQSLNNFSVPPLPSLLTQTPP